VEHIAVATVEGVGHVRWLVDVATNAVTAQLAHHAKPGAFGAALDSAANVSNWRARSCLAHRVVQGGARGEQQMAQARLDFTDREACSAISPVPVELRRDIDVN